MAARFANRLEKAQKLMAAENLDLLGLSGLVGGPGRAIAALRPGVTTGAVDAAAREVVAKAAMVIATWTW
ncbi:hypothetical protein SDD30_10670 [Moorella naiadis]|uniref:hypothetical protein n=1 Tax=Moorella naiadis (nom. illeg.) TaxID=3093670 RepID=UPI003D9CBE1A